MFSVQSAVIDHAALSSLEVTLKNLPRLLPPASCLPTLPVCSQGVLNALVVCLLHNTLLELKDSHPLGNDGVHQRLTELEKSRQLTKLLKGGLQSSEHVYQHSTQGRASSEYHMTNDEPIKHNTMNCTIFFHLIVAQVSYLDYI